MKILFVGNSHTYFNDMPAIFAGLCEARGIAAEVAMLTRGGELLSNHLKSEQVAFNLRYGGYDRAVFQECESEFPGYEGYSASVAGLAAIAAESGVKPLLYENFGPAGDFARQSELADACERVGREQNIAVAKVGRAFEALQKTRPELDLYFTDRRHASKLGSYTVAAELFAAMTGSVPESLPAKLAYRGRTVADIASDDAEKVRAALVL